MDAEILLVEDDSTLSMIVAETLQREGFRAVVAGDGEQGLKLFARLHPDAVIADVMMPKMDGFTMCRHIRAIDEDVPILFLTAKSSLDDIVEGFETGGNDYLKKPFKMLELIVRLKALIRRKSRAKAAEEFSIGRYTLSTTAQTLQLDGQEPVDLTWIEAKILKELIVSAGQTVEATALMMSIWQRDDLYSRNSLHGFIHKLRSHLRRDPAISIINQRGIGYMLRIN